MIIFNGACRPDSGLQALGNNIVKSKWHVKSALEEGRLFTLDWPFAFCYGSLPSYMIDSSP